MQGSHSPPLLLQFPKVVYPTVSSFWGPCIPISHPFGQGSLNVSQGQRFSMCDSHPFFPLHVGKAADPLQAVPSQQPSLVSSDFFWREVVTNLYMHVHPKCLWTCLRFSLESSSLTRCQGPYLVFTSAGI